MDPPNNSMTASTAPVLKSQRKRVAIIGGGFAGLNVARGLNRALVDVVVIDRKNHHLFQPLLYQVATGGLSPADISAPIRGLLRNQKNARVLLGEVMAVDVNSRCVRLTDGDEPYDILVLATGSMVTYFRNDDWRNVAPGIKTLDDATAMRSKILRAFEAAERTDNAAERTAWLTFVIVGGGPTGVELAGALAEMTRHTLKGDFRVACPESAGIILVEGGERVLPTYRPQLSTSAEKSLAKLGVTVRKSSLATQVSDEGIRLKSAGADEWIPTRTVLWAAGMSASPLGAQLAEETSAKVDRSGRLLVQSDFTVPGHREIYIIGDLAAYTHLDGSPLRGTADVAIAEGRYVARSIRRLVQGKDPSTFKFRDRGTLGVIGRSAAVVDLFGKIPIQGRLAWLVAGASAAAVLLVCLVAGEPILNAFGIGIPSFRVAGGVLIALIALSMMRPDSGPEKPSTESSVAVVPLAVPLLAGPGAISTVIIFASRGASLGHELLVGAAIVAVATIVLVAFLLAPLTESLIGKTGMRVLTQIMGLILAAIAVEFIADGLSSLFPALMSVTQ